MSEFLKEHPAAKRNRELYLRAQTNRRTWETQARLDLDFWIGNHYTSAESDASAAKGQNDPVIDRVYPAVEKLKSLLTARPARFDVLARESSDRKLSLTYRMLLDYIWDISEGNVELKDVVHDYSASGGIGFLWAFLDKDADYGRGEVKFTRVDPFRVYTSPSTQKRFWDDAPWIIVSTILDGETAIGLYPDIGSIDQDTGELKGKITKIESTQKEDTPHSTQSNTQRVHTPAETRHLDPLQRKYHQIDRFYPVRVKFWRVLDTETNTETIMDEQEMARLIEEFPDEIAAGRFDQVPITQRRIKHTVTLGQTLLFEEILNTDIYPIVPFPNIWTGTPFTFSDLSKVRDPQILLNKVFSVILQHAQASAGLKLLLPEGSADIEDVEERWADPNAVIEYNAEFGEPHHAAPVPLANTFFGILDQLSFYMDLVFGIPEILQGISNQETARGTEALSDNAMGRPRSKLQDIEAALSRVGRVCLNFARAHYSPDKILNIVQANHDREGIEEEFYADENKLPTIEEIAADRKISQYDVHVVAGSLLPNDKWAEEQQYFRIFQANGITRDTYLRKNPEIFEAREEIKKFGDIAVRDQKIVQLEESVKRMSGDLQTAERQAVQDGARVQVSKTETKLNKIVEETRSKTRNESLDLLRQMQTLLDRLESETQEEKSSDNG